MPGYSKVLVHVQGKDWCDVDRDSLLLQVNCGFRVEGPCSCRWSLEVNQPTSPPLTSRSPAVTCILCTSSFLFLSLPLCLSLGSYSLTESLVNLKTKNRQSRGYTRFNISHSRSSNYVELGHSRCKGGNKTRDDPQPVFLFIHWKLLLLHQMHSNQCSDNIIN